jgi:chemotaxis protein methyltransferase CheR
MDPDSFKAIASLAYRESGIQLYIEKTSMIQSRLRRRVHALGMESFANYANFVCSDAGISERKLMISALTTNVSHFFRENHHFEFLIEHVVRARIDDLRSGGRLRIWSAGCSNGQEPYSIAMCVLQAFPEIGDLDFKILATDIDSKVVGFGQTGVYPKRFLSGLSTEQLSKFFETCDGQDEPSFQVSQKLKSLTVFRELNLLAPWPIKGKMDAIFCRNVVIYFDLETQSALWPRFRETLSSAGVLFLGHSERIVDPSRAGFKNEGPTTYKPIPASSI